MMEIDKCSSKLNYNSFENCKSSDDETDSLIRRNSYMQVDLADKNSENIISKISTSTKVQNKFANDETETLEQNMSDSEDGDNIFSYNAKKKMTGQFSDNEENETSKLSTSGHPIKNMETKEQYLSDSDRSSDNIFSNTIKNIRTKKKQNIQYSDSDAENESAQCNLAMKTVIDSPEKNILSGNNINKKKFNLSSSEDSDSSLPGDSIKHGLENEPKQQNRILTKKNNLQKKFSLLNRSHKKDKEGTNILTHRKHNKYENSGSDVSSNEEISPLTKSIKKNNPHTEEYNSNDNIVSSDEESNDISQIKKKFEIKTKATTYKRRTTKLVSPEPIKCMSSKQAMENMQKIKSESNRMLREKEVSLPYHRPKALSLKDIMNRRKQAVTLDGKPLPLKMNSEQLKQYASFLDQRQKEMIELCKSDSDNEDENDSDAKDVMQENVHESEIVQNIENREDNNSTVTNSYNANHLSGMDNNDNISEKEILKDDDKGTSSSNVIDDQTDDRLDLDENLGDKTNNCIENVADVYWDVVSKELANKVSIDQVKSSTIDNTPRNENNHSENAESLNNRVKVSEDDSQLIALHYGSEKFYNLSEPCVQSDNAKEPQINNNIDTVEVKSNTHLTDANDVEMGFSDDDFNMAEIDAMIEKSEIVQGTGKDTETSLATTPKLTGVPGMVIDFDNDDSSQTRKLSGVELLKQRFIYFTKMKTPEELEREIETRVTPGSQHIKLRQDLKDKIDEERSLEWAKRIEENKQRESELIALRGDDSDDEDDLEKIEAKLANDDENYKTYGHNPHIESDVEDEELVENDVDMSENKKLHNPLVEDEAEESDNDEDDPSDTHHDEISDKNDIEEDSSSDDNETSSDSDDEQDGINQKKKGRILKAFEDSDDEELHDSSSLIPDGYKPIPEKNTDKIMTNVNGVDKLSNNQSLPSTQMHRLISDDLFTSQESHENVLPKEISSIDKPSFAEVIDNSKEHYLDISNEANDNSENVSVMCKSLGDEEIKLDNIAEMCSGSFSQNLISGEPVQSQNTDDSQAISNNVLALCTGQFFGNEFVSEEEPIPTEANEKPAPKVNNIIKENTLLKSILEELDDPEFDKPKPNKYFCDDSETSTRMDDKINMDNQTKRKLIIDSDDEMVEGDDQKKKKKIKKKKPEKRALQISDDEDEENVADEAEEDISDIDDDVNREVEYDSEENEVTYVEQKPQKLKRKTVDFFEQEAELTSEDEWVGSGDEDEAGLDRMEREAGDDDTFHQGKLQRELGQIHMREVLDQDKREVRMIQELLFEDGDLGEGHRQRKFRWKDADGAEEQGMIPELDSQEDEFESEEQWRKQRHERETFLRTMMKENEEGGNSPSVSINRSTIIKANLTSKSMSSLLLEVNSTKVDKTEVLPEVVKKQVSKDIPSPIKNPFALLQHAQISSTGVFSSGRSSLARLAALVTPLVSSEDQPANISALATTNHRNFVFSAISPQVKKTEISKRKADSNQKTSSSIKKLKMEDKKQPRRSLSDQIKL